MDGFYGVGGNTIQFTSTYQRVIAIDIDWSIQIDPDKIEQARHNAAVEQNILTRKLTTTMIIICT